MIRLQTRGPEFGKCNICGVPSKLTDDHIPPKGVPLVGQTFLQKLTDGLGADRNTKGKRLFQNGVTYRTICKACNGDLLGGLYDPELIEFCKSMHSQFQTQLFLPADFKIYQNRLLRSVVGHLLAHGVDQHRIGPLNSKLTDYFLDRALQFPSDLRMYCWVYPYKEQVVAKFIGKIFEFTGKSEPFIFSAIKFYPIAFMCSASDLPASEMGTVLRLDHLTTDDINDHISINLSPSNIPSVRWPETPGESGAIFLNGDYSTIARPAKT